MVALLCLLWVSNTESVVEVCRFRRHDGLHTGAHDHRIDIVNDIMVYVYEISMIYMK